MVRAMGADTKPSEVYQERLHRECESYASERRVHKLPLIDRKKGWGWKRELGSDVEMLLSPDPNIQAF